MKRELQELEILNGSYKCVANDSNFSDEKIEDQNIKRDFKNRKGHSSFISLKYQPSSLRYNVDLLPQKKNP